MTDTPDPHKNGKIAYRCTYDPKFWEFAKVDNTAAAAAFINKECGSFALREIDSSPEAIAKWQELYGRFQNGSNT